MLGIVAGATTLSVAARAGVWEDIERDTDRAISKSDVVVLARPGPKGATSLEVERTLKGTLDSRRLRMRLARKLSDEDRRSTSAWFLVRGADGVFEEVAPASAMADYFFMERAARLDRKPYPGITPRPIADGLVMDLGFDSGLGRTSRTPDQPARAGAVLLVAQITNYGPKRVLLGPLDGSEREERYPKLRLELRDAAGREVPKEKPAFVCGNVGGPSPQDFVVLLDHDTHKFIVRLDAFFHWRLPPGAYTARLHFTSRRSLEGVNSYVNVGPKKVGPIVPEAAARLETLWEGTLISEWLSFRVEGPLPDGARAPAHPAR